ncbi:hypothetical protein CFP56_012745 [Quercus suber]|uniref:Myb/SANT-like domain-containing protein n=1 Tax=Quercus suber TaxID=58331 RepID=A0AAW0KX91_QUESU
MEDTSDLLKQGMQVLFAVHNRKFGGSETWFRSCRALGMVKRITSPLLIMILEDKLNKEMDCSFIDLMLEQLHRGNKIGHRYNAQAWTRMNASFRKKIKVNSFVTKMLKGFTISFRTEHAIVLKSHYTNLWTQFNDVKRLLGQNGFSWDGTKKRVVASHHVWDAYIKEMEYSLSSHDIDFDVDIQGVNTGVAMNSLVPTSKEHSKTDWTWTDILSSFCWTNLKKAIRSEDLAKLWRFDLIFGKAITNRHCSHLWQGRNFEDDIILIKTGELKKRRVVPLLIANVLKGNKIGHGFVSESWIEMVRLFNAKFGSHLDKDGLRNRYKHLRGQYNDIKVLLDQSGFSWDETGEMSYRNKSVPGYHKLCVIYGEEICNGRYSISTCNADLDSEDPDLRIGRLDTFNGPSSHRCNARGSAQQHKGKKTDYTFNNQAWIDMFMLFKKRFSLQHEQDFLKTSYEWCNQECQDQGCNGVGGILEHPDALTYRDKILDDYCDLCLIYDNESQNSRSSYFKFST